MRGTFLYEGIDCIEQNPVIGIPDIQNLLCFLFTGVIKWIYNGFYRKMY